MSSECRPSDSRVSVALPNASHQTMNEYETEQKRNCKEISSALKCVRLIRANSKVIFFKMNRSPINLEHSRQTWTVEKTTVY